MSFTEKQVRLIKFCKSAGYGWAKFASSVESGGRCSERQEETLVLMHQRITTARIAKQNRSAAHKKYGKHNINDCEVMSFGLHI